MDPALALAQELALLQASAGEAARLLQALAVERRLLVLCRLMLHGPADGPSLAAALGVEAEELTPDLATLREQGVIGLRTEGRAGLYHIEDPRVLRLLSTLKDIFCPPVC